MEFDKPAKPINPDMMADMTKAREFAKKNRRKKGDVGNLARAYLDQVREQEMIDREVRKAYEHLGNAMP